MAHKEKTTLVGVLTQSSACCSPQVDRGNHNWPRAEDVLAHFQQSEPTPPFILIYFNKKEKEGSGERETASGFNLPAFMTGLVHVTTNQDMRFFIPGCTKASYIVQYT